MITPHVNFLRIQHKTYQEVWDFQTSLHKQLVSEKLKRRDSAESEINMFYQQHHLIFCEHSHVYTLGKSGSVDHLLLSTAETEQKNIEFFKINRGGDITYHGPGQITGYPIFDLEEFFRDVHKYVRNLEEIIIRTLDIYGIKGQRLNGYTGVWIYPDDKDSRYRKICAIGVHLSRWVSMHGFAFNVNTDLTYFENIVPCGIEDKDKTVTSLSKELGHPVSMTEVEAHLQYFFADIFKFSYSNIPNKHLETINT
ncbi:MAG: lipoyl(octanoyl) transferase LipB [Saprospiraceae bacterium]|nr:lipoyl(octanoyl) transferase LipB [Saprospiraceae bacterium]